MVSVKVLSLIALVVLSTVSLISASCDYNITSVSQLTTIFNNDQTGWTTIPTLCFAPGNYMFTSGTLALKASQKWVGPQQGVDPTCGRLINPPCARYTSASSKDTTVEAVLNPIAGQIVFSSNVPNLSFEVDGLALFGSASIYLIEQLSGYNVSLTVNNTYFFEMLTSVSYATFDRSYFGWGYSASQSESVNPVLTVSTNSFFYQVPLATSGTITAIGNTFAFCEMAAIVLVPSHFENNAFYVIQEEGINDSKGQTSFKNNLFWVMDTAYGPSVKSFIDFDSNCFIDIYSTANALYFISGVNTTGAVFNNNYFGDPNGPQIHYANPLSIVGNLFGPTIELPTFVDFDFTFSPTPLDFEAPNVCPHPPLSLTVKPSNIKLGEIVNITISFTLHPLVVGAGITTNMFDGTTLQLFLYTGSKTISNSLNGFPGNTSQIMFNPSNQSSLSFAYTFQASDLSDDVSGDWFSPPNYYILVKAQNPSGPLEGLYKAQVYAPITITPKAPLECYNMSLSINKNVTAAPLKYNFQQLGCSSSNWKILSVNTTNLFSYANSQSLQITMGTNTSGVRLAHYQISFYSGSINGQLNLAHNVVTRVTIVNHNPVINSATFTWTYPRTQQTFPNWNLLSNCTDQDGDNVAVVQIQRTPGRTPATVVQLDDFTLYFVTEKAVVSVLSTGEITLTSPSNTNPVTAGAPLPLFWKQSISFQFQITDGDVSNQYAWGIADVNFV